MPDLDSFRARLDALPVDRAPLRRAGLLTLLLVALLALTQTIRPEPRPASEMLGRQDVHAEAERVSASGGLSAGTLAAFVLLAAGGAFALWLRRRPTASGAVATSAIETIETHPLGPNHTLRLVACGDEVLLLDVGAEGTQLLRQWPRAVFEAAPASVPPLAHVEAAVPEAVAPADTSEREKAPPAPDAAPADRPATPRQFGAPSPSFADVLAQFSPARA